MVVQKKKNLMIHFTNRVAILVTELDLDFSSGPQSDVDTYHTQLFL